MKEERLEGKEGKKDKPRQDNNRGIGSLRRLKARRMEENNSSMSNTQSVELRRLNLLNYLDCVFYLIHKLDYLY